MPFLLFGFAATYSLQRSFSTPGPVKEVLNDSGIYGSLMDSLIKSGGDQAGQDAIDANNPIIKEAIKKAFPPELVKSATEQVLDGTYAWLEGQTEQPQFRVDLTAAKANFINEAAAGAQARAAGLPPCPRGQLTFDDPLTASCLPRGVTPAMVADLVRRDLQNELDGSQTEFLKNPVISADTIKSKDGQPVFSADSELPENYQRIKLLPLALALAAGLALAAIIFLSGNLPAGLKRAGIALLGVGILIIVVSLVAINLIGNRLADMSLENPVLQDSFVNAVRDVSATVGRNLLVVGLIYSVLGAASVGGAIYAGRRNPTNATSPKIANTGEGRKSKPGGRS